MGNAEIPVGHGKKSGFTFFEVEKSQSRSKKAIFRSFSIIKNLKNTEISGKLASLGNVNADFIYIL